MNYKDVALLNGSIDQLGDTLLHNRMLEDQKSEKTADRTLREKLLGEQMRRADVDDKRQQAQVDEQTRHNKATEGGHVNAWLQGPDGGIMNFNGPKTGLDAMTEKAAAAGKPFTQIAPPKAQPAFGSVTKETPMGRFTFHIRTPEEFDHAKAAVQALPSMPEKPGFQTAPIANRKAWDLEYQKAAQLEQAAAAAQGPEAIGLKEMAARVRKTADEFYKPGGAKSAPDERTVTVTQKQDENTSTSERVSPAEFAERSAQGLKKKKAARANEIAVQNPKWSRAQILTAVEAEFAK